MQRIEDDATPAEEWLQSLNATCNRLSAQYLTLLKAASSVSALSEQREDGNHPHEARGNTTATGVGLGGPTGTGPATSASAATTSTVAGRQHHNPRGT